MSSVVPEQACSFTVACPQQLKRPSCGVSRQAGGCSGGCVGTKARGDQRGNQWWPPRMYAGHRPPQSCPLSSLLLNRHGTWEVPLLWGDYRCPPFPKVPAAFLQGPQPTGVFSAGPGSEVSLAPGASVLGSSIRVVGPWEPPPQTPLEEGCTQGRCQDWGVTRREGGWLWAWAAQHVSPGRWELGRGMLWSPGSGKCLELASGRRLGAGGPPCGHSALPSEQAGVGREAAPSPPLP